MMNYRHWILCIVSVLFIFTVLFIAGQGKESESACIHYRTSQNESPSARSGQQSISPEDASGLFKPLPKPSPGDWLYEHEEPGQTLDQFLKSERNIPGGKRKYLYLQPVWMEDASLLGRLAVFAEAYFRIPVKIVENVSPSKKYFRLRNNSSSRKEQVHAGLLLEYLKERVPEDAFCVQAVTSVDLYPDESWNFVFGYASYLERVGVFSTARYDPSFYNDNQSESCRTKLLLRSCKILAHEAGHMFSMAHCTFCLCCMNGSNNLDEMDKQPIHLCPVCLEKLRSSVGFDLVERYRVLGEFYSKRKMKKQAAWIEKRVEIVSGAEG